MFLILLRTTIATLVAFAGGLLGALFGRVAASRLNILVYLALGALLAVTIFDILPDAKAHLSWPAFLIAALTGYVLFWWVGKYVSPICPSCALPAFDQETTTRLGRTATLLMVALGIHSMADGIAVVVGDTLPEHTGLPILFAISFHKLPEGMALVLLLVSAGYTRRTALMRTLTIESVTELGGLLGVFALRSASEAWLSLLFAHIGGGFLYLVTNSFALFKDERLSEHSNLSAGSSLRRFVIGGGIGFMLTGLLLRCFNHSAH